MFKLSAFADEADSSIEGQIIKKIITAHAESLEVLRERWKVRW